MARSIKTLGAVLLALSLTTPAFADVQVTLDPVDAVVNVGQTVDVDIVATFSEPIVAWGLDVTLGDLGLGTWSNLTIGPAWDTTGSLDSDGLSGMVFDTGLTGEVLLATLTFEAGMTPGTTDLTLSYGLEEDEGFLLETLVLDGNVQFAPATLTVIPEPTTLALLGFCATATLLRRR